MSAVRLLDIDPKTYVPHVIHSDKQVWNETNCFVDLWLELLHGMGHEPIACLPFTVTMDLEGDQWTFYKFPLEDIAALYGLEVIELNIWWSLIKHVEAELRAGRPVMVEFDAWYLPDTAGTSYRTQHVKTSVAVSMLDIENKRMGYFHSSGYHVLEGEDFVGVFRLDSEKWGVEHLPPYVEVAKREWEKKLPEAELVQLSLGLLKKHLKHLPKSNPFTRYKARFERDLAWVNEGGMNAFYAYAFATLRQIGSCFELLATYLRWAEARGVEGLEDAAKDFTAISDGAKSMQFKLARAVGGKRAIDHAALIGVMESAWGSGMERLVARFGEG